MDEELNVTIDPACLRLEAPLALDIIMQLDTFGLCLYSMLSFMSLLTLVMYLEQCVYIYKKVPYPKKTSIIWISGASPVITTMACFGMWVPRAAMITDMTSNCYFAVVIYKFLVLLIEELGGVTDFLQRFSGKTFRINTGPCCCCCPCLPRVSVSRGMLFLLKLGSLQYAILKTVFTVLAVILWMNGTFHLTNLSINSAMIWINPFVGVLLIVSLWPIGIVFMNTRILMTSVKIIPKYAMYQLVLVLSQLQTSIINILSLNGQIACAPPLSSYTRGAMLSQQILIMETFLISLFTRSLYHRTYDPIPFEEDDNELNDKAALKAALEEHDV